LKSETKTSKIIFLSDIQDINQCIEIMQSRVGLDIITIFGRGFVEYKGRARAESAGFFDSITMIKPDGSLNVHKRNGVRAVNWQPTGSQIKISLDEENRLCLTVTSKKAVNEVLTAVFDEIFQIICFRAEADKGLVLKGTESDITRIFVKNPFLIEEGFKVTASEFETDFGFIDILGFDAKGMLTVCEVKRRTAGPKAVQQLKRYVDHFTTREKRKVRGILIAPDASKKARNYLRTHKFDFLKFKTEILQSIEKNDIEKDKETLTMKDFF